LAQIHPSVTGLPGAASMRVMRPASTVTSMEHVSGQSSGQAVTVMRHARTPGAGDDAA
jgi:hypothetical protein